MEDLLPPEYYSKSMIGSHIDQHVFAKLIEQKLPKLHRSFERAQMHLPLITLQWFLCLFVNTLPTETVLRVWDMFFNEGDKVLFRIAIGLLKLHEAKLLSAREESGELFTVMRELGREVVDADLLIASSYKRESACAHLCWLGAQVRCSRETCLLVRTVKKVAKVSTRALGNVSSIRLEDLEGESGPPTSFAFLHFLTCCAFGSDFTQSGENHEHARDAITGSDLDGTELQGVPQEHIEAALRSATVSTVSSTTSASRATSTNITASVKSKSKKKKSFLGRTDHRTVSREDIRSLREHYQIEVEQKRQAAQRMREQWKRDEAAGLHQRQPSNPSAQIRQPQEPADKPAAADSTEEPATPTLVDEVVNSENDDENCSTSEGDKSGDDGAALEGDEEA